MKKKLIFSLICFYSMTVFSQKSYEKLNKGKTGNASEILANIYAGISSSLNQSDGTINLKATPFGIISIFNKAWKSDKMYVQKRALRNIQLMGSIIPTDSSLFKLKSGSIGLTISLVNGSDKTIANYCNKIYPNITFQVNTAIHTIVQGLPAAMQSNELVKLNSSFVSFGNSQDIADLDPRIVTQLRTQILNQSVENFLLSDDIAVKKLLRTVSNKPLLTVAPNLKYDFEKHKTSKISFKSDLQFGLQNNIKKMPKQVELTATVNTEYDTTKTNFNLYHKSGIASAGVNFVITQNKKNEKSIFEIKPYFEYTRILQNKYFKEDLNTFDLSCTFRLRLGEDTWLPLTIKYDIKHPQLLGFLTIFWNVK